MNNSIEFLSYPLINPKSLYINEVVGVLLTRTFLINNIILDIIYDSKKNIEYNILKVSISAPKE